MTGEGEGKEPFFCFRSNFRAITRLETLATQARSSVEQWFIPELLSSSKFQDFSSFLSLQIGCVYTELLS